MRLFLFELKKLLRQRKLLFLVVLLIVAVLAVTVQSKLYSGALNEKALEDIRIYQDENRLLLKQFEEGQATRGHIENYQAGYENARKMKSLLVEWEQAIVSSKWDQVPLIEADFWETIHFHRSINGVFTLIENMENTLILQQEKNKLLVDNNLPYEDESYSFTLPIFLFNSSLTVLGFPFIVLLLLLFGDVVTSEYERRTNRLLLTQPLHYPKILLTKFMTMFLVITSSVVVFVGLATIASILFNKPIFIWNYPLQIATMLQGEQLVPIYRSVGQLFIYTIVIFVSIAVFLFACHFVISQLIQKRFGAICTSLVLFIVGYTVSINVELLQAAWNPFLYLNIAQLVKNPETFTSLWQVLWLWGYSLLLLVLCYVLGNYTHISQKSVYLKPFKQRTLSNTYLNTIHFEWHKLWRLGIFKQLAILLFSLAIGGYLFLALLTEQKEKEILDSLNMYRYELSSRMIPFFEEELMMQQHVLEQLEGKEILTEAEQSSKELANAMMKTMTVSLNDAQERYEELDATIQAYEDGNWPVFYDYWIRQNELWGNIDGSTHYSSNYFTEQGGLSNFTFVASIEQKKQLSELNISPVFAIEHLNTMYDRFIEMKDQIEWNKKTLQVENTALFYIYLLFDSYAYLFVLLLLLFIFGTGWLGELRRNKTVSLLKTQPISPLTLFLGKYTLQNVSAVFFTFFTFGVITLISTVANRFGDWEFPILKYGINKEGEGFDAFEGAFHFIGMGDYVVQAIILFILAVLFIIAFASFVSTFVKNITLCVGGVLIVLALGYGISIISQPFVPFSPFTYLNIPSVLNGALNVAIGKSGIAFENGVIVFAVSIIFLFVANFIARKKWAY